MNANDYRNVPEVTYCDWPRGARIVEQVSQRKAPAREQYIPRGLKRRCRGCGQKKAIGDLTAKLFLCPICWRGRKEQAA